MIAPGRRPLFVLLDSAGEKVINWRTAEKQHARVRVPLLPEWEAPVMATVGCRFRCENDDLRWPHRDGLIWPHFSSVVVGLDVA